MVPSQLLILLFPFSPTASIPIPYLTTSLWASKSHPSSRYNHSNHQATNPSNHCSYEEREIWAQHHSSPKRKGG